MATVARDLHAEASARLERPLSPGELLVDLAAYDDALETGKAALVRAIAAEKTRVIRATVTGRGDRRLRITPAMRAALVALYAAGRATADRETRALDLPAVELADDDEEEDLPEGLLDLLRDRLHYITIRVRDGAAEESLGDVSRSAVERALERRIPGVKAAAADLVSPAFLAGLGQGFDKVSDAFGLAWRYSAIGDRATCVVCRALDGRVYPSWEAIQAVLPNGGPNPSCHGGFRCRCRPVMEPPDDLVRRREGAPVSGLMKTSDVFSNESADIPAIPWGDFPGARGLLLRRAAAADPTAPHLIQARRAVVSIDELIPTQIRLDGDQVEAIRALDPIPEHDMVIVRLGGKIYVEDGHHRVAALILNARADGRSTLSLPIFDLDAALAEAARGRPPK